MRPTLSFLLLFFTTIYICAQDTTPPVLTSITFDPASAKTGETVSVIIEAHDEMSELSYIAVNISNSIPFHRVEVTNWTAIGENQYSNEFTVYEHDVGGEWYVSSVILRDSESNQIFESFSAENSPATFNITATDPDTTPPTLSNITFDPASANTGDTVSVIVETEDDLSGLNLIRLTISNPLVQIRSILHYPVSYWTNIGGNQYRYEFTVYEHDVGGEWYVNSVSISDIVGNRFSEDYFAEDSPYTFNITATDPDTASPTLNNITFNPASAKSGDNVSVIVEAQDDLSGLNYIQLSISNPSNQQTASLYGSPVYTWTNTEENHYSQSFTIQENVLGGDWYVDYVILIDVVGNRFIKSYTAENSPATFNVTGTNLDTTPPTLSSITFDPASANTGDTVSVIVEAQDDLSGLSYMQVTIVNPSNEQRAVVSNAVSDWTNIGGNRYSHEFIVYEYDAGGEWYVNSVAITDFAGNQFYEFYSAVVNSPATFNVTATNPDTASPTLTNITFNPSLTIAGQTVLVIVETEDDLSGLNSIRLDIRHPGSPQKEEINALITSWTPLENNRYSHELTINEYALGGDWYVSYISISDNVNNYFTKTYSSENSPYKFNVTATNPDITPPTFHSITFDPVTANTGDTVSIIVETEDDLSGLNYINVEISSSVSTTFLNSSLDVWEALDNNRYRRSFTIDAVANGTWYVSLVRIQDNVGNTYEKTYHSKNESPYSFEVGQTTTVEDVKEKKVIVYPNPSESFIQINSDFSIAKIYDLNGKLQQAFHTKAVDVSALDKGFYILELYDTKKNKMATFKLIKK